MQGKEQADAALARLEPVLRAAEERARELVQGLPRDGEKLRTGQAAAAQEVARQLRRAVEDLREQATAEASRAALEGARAEAERLGVSLDLTPRLQRDIEAITRDRIAEMVAAYGEAADAMGRAVRLASTTGASVATLERDIAGKMGGSIAQARTLVDTATMGAARLVFVEDVEDASERAGVPMVYAYLGPDDQITRPFCATILTRTTGQVYTAAAIEQMGNGQIEPVRVYGGGYNCRHRWVAMTRREAGRRGLVVVE